MDLDVAARIWASVEQETAAQPELLALRQEFLLLAVRYARIRADWLVAGRARRTELSDSGERTRAHEALIDACNILSRQLKAHGRANGWRAQLGDDRQMIGDFACYLHCLVGLRAR